MMGEPWSYLALILVGFLPHEVWRWLGVAVSRGLDEASDVVVWVRAVATAVLAGVIAKIIFVPPGALADVPMSVRLTAIIVGFAGFLAIRRSVFAGVVIGESVLLIGSTLLGR